MLAGPARGQPDSIHVHCHAYHDLDEDGVLDAGEPDLEGVRFTNGEAVLTTDGTGEVGLWVDRAWYRFATMTIPAGWWPTTPWYHWVPVGTAGPDSVEFGLKTFPATASDPVRWVHVTDTQVQTWGDPHRVDEDLQQINELAEQPLVIFNTGDLVETGSDATHWENYLSQIAVADAPVFHVVGNHEVKGTYPPLVNYESYVGPPYYSLEMGSWHFISFNNEKVPQATPRQDDWLVADVAAAPAGSRFVLLQHRMVKEVEQSGLVDPGDWVALGIRAVFSGHWHSTQITERPQGIVDYNLCRTRSGPLDRTPRAFGIVTCDALGEIRYELRRLAVDHRAVISSPRSGDTVYGDSLLVVVQAYDTSSPVASLSVAVTGPGGSIATSPLLREGVSLHRVTLDISHLPSGSYDVTVAGLFEDGTPIGVSSDFDRSADPPPSPLLGADWPMFRRVAAGSSFTSMQLEPPLELAWHTDTRGMVALSSPVTAAGKVYLGVRSNGNVDESGVMACDAVSGETSWFTPIQGGVALAPACTGGEVLVTTMADSLLALDPGTGARLWAVAKGSARYDMTAPIFEGTKAWMGGEPRARQLRTASGGFDWLSGLFGSDWFPYIYSAPAVGSSYVYFGVFEFPDGTGGLEVVDRATGAVIHTEIGAFRSPIWTGTTLYAVGGPRDAQVLTARTETGAVLWTAPQVVGEGTASPALGHGTIVVPGSDGTVHAYGATDGSSRWSHAVGPALYDMVYGGRGGSDTYSTPAITDSVVWVGSLDGKLYAIDLLTGNELWNWGFGTPVASSPAVSGNMLFVGASDGHLYGFVSGAPSGAVGVGGSEGRASVFSFYRPAPNPSRSATRLDWVMPAAARVRLGIWDVTGRRVRTLVDERRGAGEHHAVWKGDDESGREVAAGVYFARLEAGESRAVQKIVRLRR